MWGLSAAVLQAISGWSLTVAGVAGVIAVAACLVSAATSAKVAELTRLDAARVVAEARQRADLARKGNEAAVEHATTTHDEAAELAGAAARLQEALRSDPPPDAGPAAFARRAEAFAALIHGRAPAIALVVGHGPGAHVSGQIMRQALKAQGVAVRWCRLKPSADADHAAAEALTVYADPARPEASALVQALASAGFTVDVAGFRPSDPGLPSPAIVFAASRQAPRAQALSMCNPVAGAPVDSQGE